MKKLLFLLFLGFSHISMVSGQFTLTSTQFPQIGDSLTYLNLLEQEINYRDNGENAEWFMNDGENGFWIPIVYKDVDETNGGFLFPDATMAEVYPVQGIQLFMTLNDGAYEYNGDYASLYGQNIYDPFRKIVAFPLEFNLMDTSSFVGIAVQPGYPEGIPLVGKTQIIMDGFGTLHLPWATITGVIRVLTRYETLTYTDSLNTSLQVDSIFSWYNMLTRGYLAAYRISYRDGEFSDESMQALSVEDIITSLPDEIKTQTVTLYPNPVIENKLQLRNPLNKELVASILTINGMLLSNHRLVKGTNTINLGNIKPGTYMLHIDNHNITQRLRFIVLK